jgi:signal transduction histidine kinase
MQYDWSAMEDRLRSDPAGRPTHRARTDRQHGRARAHYTAVIPRRRAHAGDGGDGGTDGGGSEGLDGFDDTLVEAIGDVLGDGGPGVWGIAGGRHRDDRGTDAVADGAASRTGRARPAPGALRRALAAGRAYVPRGNTLDANSFRHRHALLSWVLAAHLPALFAFGVVRGFGAVHTALELTVPAGCLVVANLVRDRRLAAFHITAGLVFCSSVLVHLSGGMIEAHFHFFVLIGLIALYQDWVPFLWNVVFTVLSHGLGSALAANSMFDHHAGQQHPWVWAGVHGVAVLAACIGVIVFWKNTEVEQRRNTVLAGHLVAARSDAAQQQSVSELFVNLARRNQSLLDRQLALITELEDRERSPEALEDLFRLDHLATRIRRNAESLLVLSGDEQLRRWGRAVPLTEVVRAATAEIEDYHRVDVLVTEHLEMAGQAVADVAHLLAELIENATHFSPPTATVQVRSHAAPVDGSRCLLTIEDTGFGMTDDSLLRANEVLTDPPDIDLRDRTLGFQVVGRLARRYGLQVRLTHTAGGGVTAVVTLPDQLVAERAVEPARPRHPQRSPRGSTSTERERRRAMLSRFQAGQRAGKAIATAPAGSLARGTGLGRLVSQEGV